MKSSVGEQLFWGQAYKRLHVTYSKNTSTSKCTLNCLVVVLWVSNIPWGVEAEYIDWQNMISSSSLFVTEFLCFSETTCLHPSACWAKTLKTALLRFFWQKYCRSSHNPYTATWRVNIQHILQLRAVYRVDTNLVKLWCFQSIPKHLLYNNMFTLLRTFIWKSQWCGQTVQLYIALLLLSII